MEKAAIIMQDLLTKVKSKNEEKKNYFWHRKKGIENQATAIRNFWGAGLE